MRQQALKTEVRIEGVGLHSGAKSTLTIKPSSENSGIVFKRVDLPNQQEIKAL